ncbi:effector protein Tle3 domain-containing protein [Paraburkholderia pallida]|uniref:DUF3274 domain-containing protein n=1 Tax=Paraburkholderia pallida TaxID=2547399 RepID=A0A4P7CWE4_9BURK|nr:DUF3274 domain-containing protein [Paraburkholderia pallida]QBQ99106.1 DUF3274 domain-containing protein [Paraburkholderia pallida]
MSATTNTDRVIKRGNAVTYSNRSGPRNIEHPRDLPGVVIFLHGVNDPGVAYQHVETGLCAGLKERLDRDDLWPGAYGLQFNEAAKHTSGEKDFDQWASIKYDPDTYQFQRTDVTEGDKQTHSMLIPFYWGYRADSKHIKGGEQHPTTLRGQYQDTYGNRLNKNFAKGGGMFNNATTNIPEMYGPGFQQSLGNRGASLRMSDFQYSSTSPDRTYYVLAAVRLAMLIREIRRFDPNETVTIVAHSQGTVISLLAQAMLAESKDKARCADCVIMVDSPYSLGETAFATAAQPQAKKYTTAGKLNTLINIVKAVTENPHTSPELTDLVYLNERHAGRAGKGWTPGKATRIDSVDQSTHVFEERDNRGKVYLYFCPEDTTVAIPNIQGIGTYGVPDTVSEDWKALPKSPNYLSLLAGGDGMETHFDTLKAMQELKKYRFYQRVWSKGGGMADGKSPLVGKSPDYTERLKKGSLMGSQENRTINAEAIVPPYPPQMFGDEGVRGNATKPGKDQPDYVGRDTLIGNPDAKIPGIPVTDAPRDARIQGAEAVKAWFNSHSTDPEDHTAWVQQLDGLGALSPFVREETPNEARARLGKDSSTWDENSYHSAMLRDDNNIRRVAAMDVAIGQAKSLDDPVMRDLLIAIADWKITNSQMQVISKNTYYERLTQESKDLIEASNTYYTTGRFPSAAIVSPTIPKMVDKETTGDRMLR